MDYCAHEHFHALVHIVDSTKLGLKKKIQRAGLSLNTKTTFKKVHCLDHIDGNVRYISCKEGRKLTKLDKDGLMGKPHTHYCRMVFDDDWLHSRGKSCGKIRDDISKRIAENIIPFPDDYKSTLELHNSDECLCDRGNAGHTRKKEVNEKRRKFYLTAKGKQVKEKYREKVALKRKIMNELCKIKLTKRADLQRETIANLINML